MKKEEGRRKKEEGRGKKEEGRRKREKYWVVVHSNGRECMGTHPWRVGLFHSR
ncbi:MAG: hypothetical protein F6K24_36160 [Okeania sp. SIO2D1]|nr:hypothetical protein [Okeania sp. SIO2D1]